jgi:hypothetical protein
VRNPFQHDSATRSRRVVESRCGNLAGREIFQRRCLDCAKGCLLLIGPAWQNGGAKAQKPPHRNLRPVPRSRI